MAEEFGKSTIIPIGTKPLEYWKQEIRSGLKYRKVFGKDQEWTKYKNMYRGFWAKGTVPVNIIFSIGRTLIPQVCFSLPRVHIDSLKPGYKVHGRVVERIDNMLIRQTGLKEELKTQILDCYTCGRGPGIIGYDSEFGFNPKFSADEYSDISLTSFNKKGELIEYNDYIKPGMPWYIRANPLDFIVPWGTFRWQEARWYGMRKMRQLKDIMEDPKYSNKKDLKASYKSSLEGSVEGRPQTQTRLASDDAQNNWVELWEIHDKRSGRVFVISLDHDRFLRDNYDVLQFDSLPAEVLGFNDDPDFFWWTPDCRLIETQQEELNDIRTMAKKHRRVALLKVLYDKDMIKKDELSKLLDEEPKVAVEVNAGVTGDIRRAVALFQSHVPPDLASEAANTRDDIREVVGFSRNQQGAFEAPGGRRTAHEAEIVRAASMIRIDERKDILADHLEKIVDQWNRIIFDQWTEERVIDVIGEDGAKYWIRFTGKEIKGDFAYKINAEESVPEDKRVRRAEIMEFIQVAKGTPGIDMQYLLETYASNFGDWMDPALLFPKNREGAGGSPEKAMLFNEYLSQQGAGGGKFPLLGA